MDGELRLNDPKARTGDALDGVSGDARLRRTPPDLNLAMSGVAGGVW